MNIKKCMLILLLFTITHETKPLIIGSNIAVSIESLVNFPLIDLLFDNIIRGFAWMKNGFTLEDSDTELEFQSTFPVSGTVDLNGGQLTLTQDLIFKNVTTLNGLGTILGNGHIVEFCSSISELPADTEIFEDTDIFFSGNLGINSDITFSGDCLLSGNSNKLDISGGSLIIDSNSTLHIKNCDLAGIIDGKIVCTDDTSSLILDNVSWVQNDNFIFDTGVLSIKDHVTFSGTGTFVLVSEETSMITDGATWKFTENLIFRTGRHPTNGNEPIDFESVNSILYLDNVAFECFDTGAQITNGMLIFNRNVTLDFLGTTTQTGVILGDGNILHDIHMLLNPGTTVDHRSGYWVYNNAQKDRLESNSVSSRLIRREGSQIYVAKDLELQRTTIDVESEIVMPIEVADGAVLSYNNSVVRLLSVELDIKANQLSSYVYQLSGNDSIFFTRGTLPLGVVVSGLNNMIKGNGSISGPIVFSDSASQLILDIEGYLRNSVTLNNSMMELSSDLDLNNEGIISGPGIVNVANYNIKLSKTIDSWSTSIEWRGDEAEIDLQGALSLKETWTFVGNETINGHGNILELSDLGQLVITDGASLTLKDVELMGLHGNNIKCLGGESVLNVLNSRLVLDSDITLDNGMIRVENEGQISGEYAFIVTSTQQFVITNNSHLILDHGLTFSYAPADQSVSLFTFENANSRLTLNEASLDASYGIEFVNGSLTIISHSTIITDTTQGISVGNGISENDFKIVVEGGAALEVSGALKYKNSRSDLFKTTNISSRLIFAAHSRCEIFKSMIITSGIVEFYDNTVLARLGDENIIGSLSVFGEVFYESL